MGEVIGSPVPFQVGLVITPGDDLGWPTPFQGVTLHGVLHVQPIVITREATRLEWVKGGGRDGNIPCSYFYEIESD